MLMLLRCYSYVRHRVIWWKGTAGNCIIFWHVYHDGATIYRRENDVFHFHTRILTCMCTILQCLLRMHTTDKQLTTKTRQDGWVLRSHTTAASSTFATYFAIYYSTYMWLHTVLMRLNNVHWEWCHVRWWVGIQCLAVNACRQTDNTTPSSWITSTDVK